MKNLVEEQKARVRDHLPAKQISRRHQVNTSFLPQEYSKLKIAAQSANMSVAGITKQLAMTQLSKQECVTPEFKLLCSDLKQVSNLLNQLYRQTNAWQRLRLRDVRSLLDRLARWEEDATKLQFAPKLQDGD